MALVEQTLLGEVDKVDMAIKRIQYAYEVSKVQQRGALYVAFSGGKDSVCVAELVKMAGVPYELHFSPTTVDPPEVLHFIRDHYPETIWEKPKTTMWKLIEKKLMPPTQIVRYCCQVFKEGGGEKRVAITGVRRAESAKRSKRGEYEVSSRDKSKRILFNDNDEGRDILDTCPVKQKIIVNPIIDWLDEDVWEFIKTRGIAYCCLYDEGYDRVGCIGCPMASQEKRVQELERYPFFKKKYLMAFDAMIKERKKRGFPCQWKTGQEVMDWWIYRTSDLDKMRENGQISFFDDEQEYE